MPKIKIENELYESAKRFSQRAGYSSVDEFIAHLLERTIQPASADESEDAILERLKGLGYIS